jgi:hypothetical protein
VKKFCIVAIAALVLLLWAPIPLSRESRFRVLSLHVGQPAWLDVWSITNGRIVYGGNEYVGNYTWFRYVFYWGRWKS